MQLNSSHFHESGVQLTSLQLMPNKITQNFRVCCQNN